MVMTAGDGIAHAVAQKQKEYEGPREVEGVAASMVRVVARDLKFLKCRYVKPVNCFNLHWMNIKSIAIYLGKIG